VGRPKLSYVLKRLALRCLRDPKAVPSSEAAHVGLPCAHVGWNAALGHPADGYQSLLDALTRSRPDVWSELRSSDPAVLIEQMRRAKLRQHRHDRRIVMVCRMRHDSVHVEWCEEADYPAAVTMLRAGFVAAAERNDRRRVPHA
jgi:hypothetical protein